MKELSFANILIKRKRIFITILFSVILGCLFYISACYAKKGNSSTQTLMVEPLSSLTSTSLSINNNDTPLISSPTSILLSGTPTLELQSIYGHGASINVTQIPIKFTTNTPAIEEYLYKDTFVTISFVDKFRAIAYFNLDDLVDSGMKNSDIEIVRSMGNEVSYTLLPTNSSYFYYSETNELDYASCLKHFIYSGEKIPHYNNQGVYLLRRSGSFCILTNERRIAIISYVNGSKKELSDGIEELSFNVSVFKEVAVIK
jgi:hypothetical protein